MTDKIKYMDHRLDVEFRLRIKEVLKDIGVSAYHFAKSVKLPPNSITRLTKDNCNVKLGTLIELAYRTGKTLDELVEVKSVKIAVEQEQPKTKKRSK